MAEGFELVRTIRQHLRRSATLLDESRFDEALVEVDAALALDPQSLPAQALRDRIHTARVADAPLLSPRDTGPAHTTSRSYVPHGVNAASWRGFEQRIAERRFKALLDTVNTSLVSGDAAAARLALEEARELRPDAAEIANLEARIAVVPVLLPTAADASSPRIWMRALGAAAMFLVGVSLMLGLEWMRPGEPVVMPPPPPVTMPEAPAVKPTQNQRQITPDLGPVPIALNEEESVPAVVTPPEPLQPRATTGTTVPEIASRALAMRDATPPAVERTLERSVVEDMPATAPIGEVSDDYVAAPRNTANSATDAARVLVPSSRVVDTPVSADSRGRTAPPAASMASAVVVPEQGRVEEVLRRYARAYGDLNASAARAVWPTVDEKALTRAFQNLASQDVSFDDCDIDIRGAVANASCRGQASYAPKVGNRERRTEPRTWRFELRRESDGWKIENAEARRQSSAEFREP